MSNINLDIFVLHWLYFTTLNDRVMVYSVCNHYAALSHCANYIYSIAPSMINFLNSCSTMADDIDMSNQLQHFPAWHGYLGILFTFTFFQVLNKIVRVIGLPKSAKIDQWRWTNLFISWIHAVIAGTWNILW